jgi:hypothetical protein
MSVDLGALATASFSEFGASLAGSLTENGVGPDVSKAWHQVLMAKSMLSHTADQAAEGIETIVNNPALLPDQARAMVQQNKYLADLDNAKYVKDMQTGLATIKQALLEAEASKVQVADVHERSLIRQELDQVVAANTKPIGDGVGGQPYRPGQTMTQTLADIVRSDPARYGAEISGAYGANLMRLAGEVAQHGALVNLVKQLTPDTQRSQTARASLDAMQRSRIEGMAAGLGFTARQRVEAALTPKAPERGRYIPDTIRPIR